MNPKQIKKISLEYCKEHLENNEPHHDPKESVKMISRLHSERMKVKVGKGCMIEKDEFWNVLAKFKKNI